jgi:hypothetical protein
MKKIGIIICLLFLTSVLAACSLKATPDPSIQIQLAVASTLNALPNPTSPPTSRPLPTPTPFTLAGLFCEYQFCIGHPPEMAFYDVVAKQNNNSPIASTHANGILAAYNNSLFIQFIWQYAPDATDPVFLLDLILEDGLDAPVGSYSLKLIHDTTVMYSPITTTASPQLPYGGVAGWICGDRVFAWKVYTPQAEGFEPLLNDALDRFTCQVQ